MDECTKSDCFGYRRGKCAVLTEICEECKFYKQKIEYLNDRLASFEYRKEKYGKLSDEEKRECKKILKQKKETEE